MQNWTCTTCDAFNSPRREACWNCGNGRSITTNPISQKSTGNIWTRVLQIFRFLGAISAAAIIASLFLPWVIRKAPNSELEIIAGYTSIYGLITAVIGLILLFFMVKANLAKGWYVLAIILAIITYFVSWVPAQMSQVNDAILAAIAGSEANSPVSIAGVGVTVVNLAVILVIIAAISQFFRPAKAHLSGGKLTGEADPSLLL